MVQVNALCRAIAAVSFSSFVIAPLKNKRSKNDKNREELDKTFHTHWTWKGSNRIPDLINSQTAHTCKHIYTQSALGCWAGRSCWYAALKISLRQIKELWSAAILVETSSADTRIWAGLGSANNPHCIPAVLHWSADYPSGRGLTPGKPRRLNSLHSRSFTSRGRHKKVISGWHM